MGILKYTGEKPSYVGEYTDPQIVSGKAEVNTSTDLKDEFGIQQVSTEGTITIAEGEQQRPKASHYVHSE